MDPVGSVICRVSPERVWTSPLKEAFQLSEAAGQALDDLRNKHLQSMLSAPATSACDLQPR